MPKPTLQRILRSFLTMAIVITVVFSLLRLMPIEGYFENYDKLSQTQIDLGLQKLGLTDPLPKQLWNFGKQLLSGDLGTSIRYRKGVSINTIVAEKAPVSLQLGLTSLAIALCLGLPLGVFMARHKDGIVDKLGTFYIVFIMAVPSLAYIFLFKAIGGSMGLPTTFDVNNGTALMYVLPIVSLALPSVANLMKWLRRYMIDQMNSDYVKFARSGGLNENEIFFKHIFKNAAIPIVHGIPSSVLFAMTGAIITERVYVVPGAGNLLTQAINFYDNSVIVGVTLFYALLSVVSIILGDILMATVDPRISFSDKAR